MAFGKGKQKESRRSKTPVGEDLSFAAAEAYRLLRTNLLFSMPDEHRCRVIGITSAGPGEGKTTTSMNLAYMIAESSKQVLLIEGDMRLPTIAKQLDLQESPGLSNFLAGLASGKKVMQDCGIEENMKVITSGDIPPNPSELLGSEGMKTAVEVFSQNMDYIIIDLPPVNEVSDALIASRLVDGVVMVVRQGYASRRAVSDAMAQLKYANAKVLGFVMTRSDLLEKGNYKKYGRYGGKYYSYYSYYGYGEAQRRKQLEDSNDNTGGKK